MGKRGGRGERTAEFASLRGKLLLELIVVSKDLVQRSLVAGLLSATSNLVVDEDELVVGTVYE